MELSELFGYTDKTVVVSGAFSGMGYAAASLLTQLGANVYAICRRNGRHQQMDLPVKKILYADFAVKEDIDRLADELPENISALFLCHGIAQKNDGSNAILVQKVNFLGHKYLLEKMLSKVEDNGSVNIISSTGAYGWEQSIADCMEVINAPTYEAALEWYEENLQKFISTPYPFSKQCLCAYVKAKVHAPEYIDRRIRINAINPGNTITGLSDDFNRCTSPTGDAAEGKAMIEEIFLDSWNGRWASAEEMGYPLVAIGSKIFSYMSGQVIYFDYGLSSSWDIDDLI